MTSDALRVEHIAQPAVLVDDLDVALDWLSAVLKAYPSERVDISGAGVNNAVYAFANRTYLELIEPYNPQSGAYRLLKRFGPGWQMLNVDIVDADSADVEDALTQAAARVVQRNKTVHVKGAWHHPVAERFRQDGARFDPGRAEHHTGLDAVVCPRGGAASWRTGPSWPGSTVSPLCSAWVTAPSASSTDSPSPSMAVPDRRRYTRRERRLGEVGQ